MASQRAAVSIQILSDLHLEAPKAYDVFDITSKAPYLALLGDIGTPGPHKPDFFAFLTRQLRRFRAVLFVPGNHEAYCAASWANVLDTLRAFAREVAADPDPSLGQFVLLDRAMFRPAEDPSVAVLGCSLFSAVPEASRAAVGRGLNDFYLTGDGWDVAAHDAAHVRDRAWLNAAVAELEDGEGDPGVERIVVLSHWSPTTDARAVEPRHAGSPVGCAFATDMSGEACFRSGKVVVWAFGHTHYNCDFVVEREGGAGAAPLRLVTNQRGYYFAQAPGFDGEKTIEV